MTYALKAAILVVAVLLGAVGSQFISSRGVAGSGPQTAAAPEAAAAKTGAQSEEQAEESQPKPQVRSRERNLDLPLKHAILREEKDDENSIEAQIIKTLAKPTTVEFLDLPLEDCLTFLKEHHKVNIVIMRGAMTEEGVALDSPVSLKLADVSFESILHLILEPLQLDWVIQDEVLKITTAGWAAEHPETRPYAVQNLIESGHTPEELITSITKCIEPQSWIGPDATAGISHSGGVLIIRQSQRAHSEIAHLLMELDEIAAEEEENGGKDAKNAIVSVKIYHTGPQPAEAVAECVQEFVAAKTWKANGGEGKVRAVSGALVIENTAEVHQSVRQFLAQLPPARPAAAGQPGLSRSPAGGGFIGGASDPFGVTKPSATPVPPASK